MGERRTRCWAPAGVCATGDGLYVSDTGNSRILKFDHSGRLLQVFTRPDFPGLDASTAYSPRRLAVDYAGRLYVICEGINRGVLQLNADGSFFSFLGAPKVSYTLYELFLRSVATEEQLDKMEKFVPTEYSSLCIDAKGFLYVTSSSASVKAIGRLNTVGENILKYQDGPSASRGLERSRNRRFPAGGYSLQRRWPVCGSGFGAGPGVYLR